MPATPGMVRRFLVGVDLGQARIALDVHTVMGMDMRLAELPAERLQLRLAEGLIVEEQDQRLHPGRLYGGDGRRGKCLGEVNPEDLRAEGRRERAGGETLGHHVAHFREQYQ